MFLRAESVTKVYGKKPNSFTALKGVSLDVKEGESVAIVGKSGSGKSTLMHVLATLDRADSGVISFEDKDLSKFSQRRLDTLRNQEFGFIFQQFFLSGRETVLENVILPLKIRGMSLRVRKERAMQVLRAVDLLDKANNKANDLSGGQKQRVCIARAIVTGPSVIFADEPTGNLDTENGQRVVSLLSRLNKKLNITLIIVTHDEELAAQCDRRLYMKDGVLNEDKKR